MIERGSAVVISYFKNNLALTTCTSSQLVPVVLLMLPVLDPLVSELIATVRHGGEWEREANLILIINEL